MARRRILVLVLAAGSLAVSASAASASRFSETYTSENAYRVEFSLAVPSGFTTSTRGGTRRLTGKCIGGKVSTDAFLFDGDPVSATRDFLSEEYKVSRTQLAGSGPRETNNPDYPAAWAASRLLKGHKVRAAAAVLEFRDPTDINADQEWAAVKMSLLPIAPCSHARLAREAAKVRSMVAGVQVRVAAPPLNNPDA